MKIMNWIRWMSIISRLWYIYECLLDSWHTSVGFTFGVFCLLTFMAQWTFAFLGLEMRALAWGVGYDRRWWWRHQNDFNGVVLVSLLFALDMFQATFCCFRFWLWACRRLWGIICCKYIFLNFFSSSGLGSSWTIGWLVLWTKYCKRIVQKLGRLL